MGTRAAVRHLHRSRGPSPHLSWAECDCRDGTPYPRAWISTRLIPLAVEFELLRAECGGQPIPVSSLYRTRGHNSALGGAPRSQHVQGRAMDLRPPADLDVGQFHARVIARAEHPDSLVRYVRLYEWGAHIDIRPRQRVAIETPTWRGSVPE